MAARRQAQVRAGNEPPDSAHSDWPRLGSRIRAAREGLGLSLAEVAERAVVGDYTMGQVEAGAADPGRRVVEILDAEFGAEGVLVDAWAQVYISHHVRTGSPINEICREAAQVRAFAPLMIPDHVQTTDYTHALDTAERPMEPHYHVADRPRLPRLMATGSGPPFHCLVLDESALHRSVGTPDIMRDQMAHLHRLAQAAHVTVHIIPSGTPHHPGLRGAFWTLAFSPPPHPGLHPLPARPRPPGHRRRPHQGLRRPVRHPPGCRPARRRLPGPARRGRRSGPPAPGHHHRNHRHRRPVCPRPYRPGPHRHRLTPPTPAPLRRS